MFHLGMRLSSVVSRRVIFLVLALSSPSCAFPTTRAALQVPSAHLDGLRIYGKRSIEDKETPASFQGWTSQPNGRGTIDIIWSCVFTIFLCSWSVICLNVPAETGTYWEVVWRKLCLTGFGVMGPEFIFQSALGQWISARRSVRQFHASGFRAWTMDHAFFADMGGFILHTPDWVPFPVDAKQLHYLVTKSYLPYPSITIREIKDRNKIDALLRFITVLQTLWFLLDCLARVAQHLAITIFELITIGFIFCTIGTYLCWAHKPADVDVPVVLHYESSVRHILLEAGDTAARPYCRTPLDFVSRKEWSWSLWWSLLINVLRKMHIRIQPKVRPVPRIGNDDWLEIPPAGVLIVRCFDMAYAAIYFGSWNFAFATPVERMLWRISTITILVMVFSYSVVETYTFWLLPALRQRMRQFIRPDGHSRSRTWFQNTRRGKIHNVLEMMRNNSPNKDPQLYVPLKASVPITISAAVYSFARAYILLECLLALRKLPSSAYQTVNWAAFIPHV